MIELSLEPATCIIIIIVRIIIALACLIGQYCCSGTTYILIVSLLTNYRQLIFQAFILHATFCILYRSRVNAICIIMSSCLASVLTLSLNFCRHIIMHEQYMHDGED